MSLNKILNTAYSFGAAVVVFGAWAKLEHHWFSSTALTAGLLTETGLFFLYGLLEWRREPAENPAGQRDKTGAGGPDPAAAPSAAGMVPERRGTVAAVDNGPALEELTTAVQRTNQLLSKVFRTGEG